jgi:hypothetical protein
MIWASIIYTSLSLIILIALLQVVLVKQWKLRTAAVYYLLIIIGSVTSWVICDMMQTIFSSFDMPEMVLLFSRAGTISAMMLMVATILYTQVLTKRRTMDSTSVAIISLLFGGVVALTLVPSYRVRKAEDIDFYFTEVEPLWIILNGLAVLFAGIAFLRYLVQVRKRVKDEEKGSVTIMSLGIGLAYLGPLVPFLINALYNPTSTIHLEVLIGSIGIAIFVLGLYKGGKHGMYYTSNVISIHIVDAKKKGIYSAVFETGISRNELLVSGVTKGITKFGEELIGKEILPREVDLGRSSLIIEKEGEHACIVNSESPTHHLQRITKRIIENYKESNTTEEISELVEKYIGMKPIVVEIEENNS